MRGVVKATFIDGVFRPDESVDLPENARVRLLVQPLRDATSSGSTDADWRELDDLLSEFPIQTVGTMPTRDQLHERD